MNENMQSTDLRKFNEKYLKCIITQRSSTMRALKDHGAIIIYKNSGYNNLYLGDEFIASGYGFKSKDELSSVSNILGNYESNNKIINDKLNEHDETLNDIRLDVRNMLDEYKPTIYVKDKIGNQALLNDVFFLGKPAEYKDFEIKKIVKTIVYNNSKILAVDNEQTVFDFPLGTIINSITYDISCELNDCGGINYIHSSFFKNSNDSINGNARINEISSVQWQNVSNSKTISFKQTFDEPFIIDVNSDIKLINSVRIDIKGTTEDQYKEYPELTLTDGNSFQIYSLENIIYDHSIIIGPLWVHPTLSLKYCLDTRSDTDINVVKQKIEYRSASEVNGEMKIGEIEIKNLKKGDINDIYIDIDGLNIKKINLFIPVACTMNSMHYITNHSDYNWTGAVGVLKELSNTKPITLLYNKPNVDGDENLIYIEYNFYQIQISDDYKFSDTGKLHIKLLVLNDEFNTNLHIGNENVELYEPAIWELLNNEDFNRIYWVSYHNLGDDINNIENLENDIKRCYTSGITNINS